MVDDKRKAANDDDDGYDHSSGGGGEEGDRSDSDLSEIEKIDPKDEDLDDPNDSQTQAEKTKYLSKLQLATQTSVKQLNASKKRKSPEVTIPLSLIIIYPRWARRFPLHYQLLFINHIFDMISYTLWRSLFGAEINIKLCIGVVCSNTIDWIRLRVFAFKTMISSQP
jgi:hypothetical protein